MSGYESWEWDPESRKHGTIEDQVMGDIIFEHKVMDGYEKLRTGSESGKRGRG